jgi:hypothetical protein
MYGLYIGIPPPNAAYGLGCYYPTPAPADDADVGYEADEASVEVLVPGAEALAYPGI